jgi:acetyl esterase/lipase
MMAATLLWASSVGAPARLINGTATALWQNGSVPGERAPFGPEKHTAGSGSGDEHIFDVDLPTITPMLAAHNPSGSAVIVAPGGGYEHLAYGKEGIDIARWLNSLNISAFVLKYRVPARPWLPFGGAPLMDAQRAMGLVRANAAALGVNETRVGFIGFSAGGHLTAHLSASSSADLPGSAERRSYPKVDEADDKSCRPLFSLLIYPWKLVDDATRRTITINITASHPPSFLNQAEDDPVHMENALFYYYGLKTANAPPSELHVYPRGGHGYGRCTIGTSEGLGDEVCHWPGRAELFLQKQLLSRAGPGVSDSHADSVSLSARPPADA